MTKKQIKKEFDLTFNAFKHNDKLYFVKKEINKNKFEYYYKTFSDLIKISSIDYCHFKIISTEEDELFITLKTEFYISKSNSCNFTSNCTLVYAKNKNYFEFYLDKGEYKYFNVTKKEEK